MFKTIFVLAAAWMLTGCARMMTAQTVPSRTQALLGVNTWPTTSKIHIGERVLIVVHGSPDEISCAVSDLGQDAITCAGAHGAAPVVYLRTAVSVIETAPRDFRGHARLFLKSGGLLLVATLGCALLSGSVACAVPAVASVALVFGGLACGVIDTHNAITGLNRKRILYADAGSAGAA